MQFPKYYIYYASKKANSPCPSLHSCYKMNTTTTMQIENSLKS